MVIESKFRSKRRLFDEIRLLDRHVVRWQFLHKENRWEIAAYDKAVRGQVLPSVTGEPIQAWTNKGPGSEEFSEALGMIVLSASLKVQSKRINGRRGAF